ncbi:putative antirepressor, partial [Salmonella enterica subsp. enterica serovar Newport str. Pond080-2TTA]
KQALRVAARESKAVRRSLIDKLEALQQAQSPSPVPAIPQSLPEALRLAAELAEQKQQLEEQLQTAAPKVDFADRVANAGGILIGNYAKVVGLGQNFLFTWLRDHGILCASGSRRNVPKQNFIEQGFFTVREVVIDNDDNYRIALTTHITGKGQQWLTRKLLDAGILKPVART